VLKNKVLGIEELVCGKQASHFPAVKNRQLMLAVLIMLPWLSHMAMAGSHSEQNSEEVLTEMLAVDSDAVDSENSTTSKESEESEESVETDAPPESNSSPDELNDQEKAEAADSESETVETDKTPGSAESGSSENDEQSPETSETESNDDQASSKKENDDTTEHSETDGDAGSSEPNFSKDLTEHGVDCSPDGPCMVVSSGLPMRALPRSFSPLYAEADDSVDPMSNAVTAFKPMFVFDIKELDDRDASAISGWYQLGYSQRRPSGWMRAKDIVEWRQALLLEYTHPGAGSNRRTPVVMFSELELLQEFVTTNGRKSRTEELISQINKGEIPAGVIGKEPSRFLNIDDDFYLLPVVNWQREETFDDPSHYLEVVAAVPGSRAETKGESTLEDEDFLKEDLLTGDALTDIVFIMDMTGSMTPYIEAVKETVGSLVEKLSQADQGENPVKFGLVGYRDSVEATPDLQWDVKNFTPELLDASDFHDLLNQAEAAKVSSDEWSENVHGGYLQGINSRWRTVGESQKSMRLMLLIGDASGHDLADPKRGYKNSTGRTAEDLYELARRNGIFPFTIHLRDGRAERDWEKAQSHFAKFAFKQTDGNNFTFSTQTDYAEENLNDTAQYIGGRFKVLIEGGIEALDDFAGADADPDAPVSNNEEGQQMIELARGVMQAAIADFLGDGAKPPKDFNSWVHDYDLADPVREALSVRVLITRKDFDNIIRQVESLLSAMQLQTMGNVDFLIALKQSSARSSLGLEITAESSFDDQEFLPKWVSALPYKSRVLAMKPDEFANLAITRRKQFLARLESKLNAYEEISGNTDLWLKLDENDDSLEEVVALWSCR